MTPSTAFRTTFLFTTLLFLLLPSALWAEGSIECRYLQATGLELRLEITIQKPAPASIILMQQLPTGIRITNSSPPLQKFNQKKGEAKWLLKDLRPGKMTLSVTLDSPVQPGSVSGEIRYKDPVSGSMITSRISP